MIKNLFGLVIVLAISASGFFYYIAETEGDGDMCVAKANLMAAQIPPALDTLSEKHPWAIGLIRNFLNQDGALDDILIDIISEAINEEDVDDEKTQIECAIEYVDIYFRRDEIQAEIVLTVEEELGLES